VLKGQKKKKKRRKSSNPRFKWSPEDVEKLKDELTDRKIYDDPSVEQTVEIADALLKKKVPLVTGEIVRSKCRSKELKSFVAKLKRERTMVVKAILRRRVSQQASTQMNRYLERMVMKESYSQTQLKTRVGFSLFPVFGACKTLRTKLFL